MTAEAYLVLAILAAAVVLFSFEWIAAEVVALLVLFCLAVTGILSPKEAFSGFGSQAVIAIGSLLVIGAGLVRSGAVLWMAERLGVLAGSGFKRLLLVSTSVPGLLSGFINIIASITIFIPAVLRLARRSKLSASGLLLPMALSGLLGANLTLIGAGHNLVVNDLLRDQTQESFGFFEFAPIGAILLIGIIAYAQLFSKMLLRGHSEVPKDPHDSLNELIATYELNARLWECQVGPDSQVAGRSLGDIAPGKNYGLGVLMVLRRGRQIAVESRDLIIQADDVLALSGRREQLEALVRDHDGMVLMGQLDAGAAFTWSAFDLVEVSVPPRSALIGATLREKGLRRNYGLIAISLWRDGRPYRSAVIDRPLQAGDGILLFGSRSHVSEFRPEPDMLWLHPPRKQEAPLQLRKFAPIATLIFLAVIASAALDLMSIAVASLAGAATMVLLGIIPPRLAYRQIDWRTLILVGAMYPVGLALQKTGTAVAMADLILQSAGAWGPVPALAAVGFMAMLLTQPLHNAVAAVIMTPVALQVAGSLGANPKAFALAVLVGASASFLMPVGHPAPLMVQSPGGYRNRDYLKFGIGAALFVLVVITAVIPLLWPLGV